MSSVSDVFRAGSVYEQLIDQLITLESSRKFAFEDQVAQQQTRKTAISDVGSNLSAFDNLLSEYLDFNPTQFNALAPFSSNTDAFTVSNQGNLEVTGSFNVEVNQLAKNDVKVSARFSDSTNTIASSATDLSFDIQLGSGAPTTINVDLTGVTNDEEALDAVAQAIEDAGIEGLQATVLKETSTTSRLSIRTEETGSDNQITITAPSAGAGEIAEILQLTSGGTDNTNLVGASANGGRLFNASELDAEFTIDGLTFTRSNNEVDDAIDGLTINLLRTTSQVETISIDQDTESAQESVQSFIDGFNELNSQIRSQSFLNAESGDRGPLANDRFFRDLTFTLRGTLTESVELEDGSTLSIFDFGLDIEQDGSLVIADQAALDSFLANRAEDLQYFFSNDIGSDQVFGGDTREGLAVRLSADLDRFVGSDGLITSLTNSIDDRIQDLNERIQAQEEFLERRREILRAQFQQLEEISNLAQSQFQTIQSIGVNTPFLSS